MLLNLLLVPALMLLPAFVAGFGNEYVHIKVHVPKEQAPSIAVDAEPAPPHKVIHHFHHHAPPHLRSRGRAPPKPKTSPLLESVILSDLDKPLHMSEHADYLNHAKELAEHLSESYAIKKPPPPPKKKVNTYTIIEEKHRPNSYDDYESRPEHSVDTYRVIDSRPQHHHHTKQQHHHHHDADDDDDDVGYHYSSPGRHYRHKSSSSTSYHAGTFAEPAPVEEHLDLDQTYSYSPPPFYPKSARAPAHTLEAPEESHLESGGYQYDYSSSSSSSGGSSSGFRPSTQLVSQTEGYEDDIDSYAAPVPTSRHRRPGPVDWPSRTGFNSAASETYNGLDSYNVGHVQGLGSGGYQYPGPYL